MSEAAGTRPDHLLSALYAGTADLRVGDRRLAGDDLAGAVGAVAATVGGARTVLVTTRDPLETLVAVAGVVSAGGTAVPLSPSAAPAEREHVVGDSDPDLVLDRVELSARDSLPEQRTGWTDSSPALLLYTSGSTGRPKGVPLSSRSIRANLDALAQVWEWNADDILVHGLPLSHVHGLVFGGLGPLRIGSRLEYTAPTLRPVDGGTVYFGVPTMWGSLGDGAMRALSGARLLASGAAPLPQELFARLEALSGHQVVDRYAMTETLVNTAPRIAGSRVHGSLGQPLPGVDIQLRDVGIDEDTGEVHVRGPNVFSGYLGHGSALDADGWFATGDLGRWAEDGSLRLVGRRATDLIKTAGYRVGAGEVEEALLSYPDVADAAVIGVPDDIIGERVVAWIVVSGQFSKASLLEHTTQLLAPYKRPRDIHIVDSLPRNHLGKLQKALLRP